MIRILLVEDDVSLGSTLKERLEREGYAVVWKETCSEAKEACRDSHSALSLNFSLIILDIGLPDGFGLDFGRDVRVMSDTPILFLSAMSSAENRLEAMELGMSDFVPKPFHLKELLIKIERILQGSRSNQMTSLSCGSFSLLPSSKSIVFFNGATQQLSSRDFSLLYMLVKKMPVAVSREEVLEELGIEENSQTGRTIDNSIVRLRQLLKPYGCDYIKSIRGIGYQWACERMDSNISVA